MFKTILYSTWLLCLAGSLQCGRSGVVARDPIQELDSTHVVRLAVAALSATSGKPASREYRVVTFTRDRAGYFVELEPVLAPELVGTGGAARLRVSRAGVAKVIEVLP